MNKAASFLAAGLLTVGLALPASAMDNSYYGETRFNQLPNRGRVAHKPWVGSWWAYSRNGIALRHKIGAAGFGECNGVSHTDSPQKLVDDGKTFCLSAAEKIDFLMGRLDAVQWEEIKTYQDITKTRISPFAEQLRTLVRRLNRWIDENPGGDWRETDDGKEYLRITGEKEQAEADLPSIQQDTAVEFEHLEHGNGVPGVGGWWGHCNAWAAAALMEDEPVRRGAVTHDGKTVDFTPGEAKALLTEAWMEHNSSFYGARHDDTENEGISYDDVTPAAFHIYFGTQLGARQKGFVIDRYTGDQVWNQAMRSYVWSVEKLYQADPVRTALSQTEYNRYTGKASKADLGERDVYPVQVTATIHWMTDGLPHEAVTVANILEDAYPTNDSQARALWGDQVHIRTLTYTLHLDRPMEDPAARIIGDGAWAHAMERGNQAHPDFMWQPLNQTGSQRNYENPNIEYDRIVTPKIMPEVVGEEPSVGSDELTSGDTPLDIPDNNPAGIKSVIAVAEGGRITSAAVAVDITHTYQGDLRVVLEHGGRTYELHNRTGGGADNIEKTFDLPGAVGTPAQGNWTLSVVDLAGQDVGKLNTWSLDLTYDDNEDPGEDPGGDAGEGEFSAADTPIDIPDNNADGISSALDVPANGNLTRVSVKVDIAHTYRGDLIVKLVKNGQEITLHNRAGGGADNLKETYEVSALVGTPAAGAWALKVYDRARRDVGKLNAWSVDVAWQ